MQFKTANGLKQLGLITLIFFGLSACNDGSNSDKITSDSISAAKTDSISMAASKDSAAQVARAKKKKVKTSVSMPMANEDKLTKDAHGVYNRAEVMPQFPGGQDALANYINNNLAYSQEAIDNSVDGTIKVTFVVDENGKVTNPEVMSGKKLGNGLEEKTLGAFKNMPVWTPGKVHGKKVKTRLEMPITFQLEDA